MAPDPCTSPPDVPSHPDSSLGPSPYVHALDMPIHTYVKCWQTPHCESEASPALSHTSCSSEDPQFVSSLFTGAPWLGVPLSSSPWGESGVFLHPHTPHHSREAPGVPQQPESPRHPSAPRKVLCLHPHTFQTSTHALGVQKPAAVPHHALHVPQPLPHMCSPNHRTTEAGKDI